MSFKIVVVAATAGIVAGVTGALTLGPILRRCRRRSRRVLGTDHADIAGFFSFGESADVVLARNSKDTEPRLASIMDSFVRHLNSFVKVKEVCNRISDEGGFVGIKPKCPVPAAHWRCGWIIILL